MVHFIKVEPIIFKEAKRPDTFPMRGSLLKIVSNYSENRG